jgi:hypothetical protein
MIYTACTGPCITTIKFISIPPLMLRPEIKLTQVGTGIIGYSEKTASSIFLSA